MVDVYSKWRIEPITHQKRQRALSNFNCKSTKQGHINKLIPELEINKKNYLPQLALKISDFLMIKIACN
jgi:hypothetical protein